MPNFEDGKIYKLVCLADGFNKVYIGSTTQTLKCRLAGHVHYAKNKKSSLELQQMFETDDVIIQLIELFPCNSRYELEKREYEIINKNLNVIVNVKTEQPHFDKKLYQKQYMKAYKKDKIMCINCHSEMTSICYKKHLQTKMCEVLTKMRLESESINTIELKL